MPSALQQRQLAGGDIGKLRVNGELVGFWNSQKAHGVSGAEMQQQLPDTERNAEAGLTFNSRRGYMQWTLARGIHESGPPSCSPP
jgi:hypothetical protein